MSKPTFVYLGLQTSCSVSNRRTTTSAALSRRLSTLKYCHLNYPSSTCPPAYASPQWSAPQVTTLHWRTRWNACSSAPPCRPQPSRQTSSWGRAPGWTPFSQEQPQRPFSQPQKLSRLSALPRCLRSNLQRCKQVRGWSGDALGLATCLTRDPNPINKSPEENKRKCTLHRAFKIKKKLFFEPGMWWASFWASALLSSQYPENEASTPLLL